jgi:hypothetical protein
VNQQNTFEDPTLIPENRISSLLMNCCKVTCVIYRKVMEPLTNLLEQLKNLKLTHLPCPLVGQQREDRHQVHV